MKFTQSEIIELKKISAEEKVPMTFFIDSDDSIDYDFANNKSINSIIKKEKDGYKLNATNSNGDSFFVRTDLFDQLKIQVRQWIRKIKRDNPFELEKKENISSLSTKFYDVFQEGIIIYELGFAESSGMIYRKALEILVKDFLKSLIPDFINLIEENTIGQIIYHFYEAHNDDLIIKEKKEFTNIRNELTTIRLLVKKIRNSFKIGNDFSHYERKLSDFTASDIKTNIIQIVLFIDNLIEEKKLQRKRIELDSDFSEEKLI